MPNHTQSKRYGKRVLAVVILCVLVSRGDVGNEAQPELKCDVETQPSRAPQVSVLVGKSERPGKLCARVVNGLAEMITYGVGAVWLERRWFGLFWSSTLHFKDFFRPRQPRTVPALGFMLRPGETRDEWVWTDEEHIPPGRYRACFSFHLASTDKVRHYAYSEAIALP